MLRKIIVCLLILVMTLSFAACKEEQVTQQSSGNAAISQSDTVMTFPATVDVKGKWSFSSGSHSYILTFYDDNTVEFISNNGSSGIDGLYHGRWSMSANEVTLELSDTLTEAEFTSVLTADRADPTLTLTSILGQPLISGYDFGQPMVFTAVQ